MPNYLTSWGSSLLAHYIRFVYNTSRVIYDPQDAEAFLCTHTPVIMATWHGQFLMTVKLKPAQKPVNVMVARHKDAELIGQALMKFDVGLVRGAGAGSRRKNRGGAKALRDCVKVLQDSTSIVMTADVPPGPARVCGKGIITMAKMSGRPILPAAVATQRFLTLNTWSRFTLNLPFSKMAFVLSDPVFVPQDADEDTCEVYRQQVENTLNEITRKAYALAGSNFIKATPASALQDTDPVSMPLSLKTYTFFTNLARSAAPYILSYRAKRGKEDLSRQNERLGQPRRPRPKGDVLWFHAASVGETNAALPVITELNARHPNLHFLLTTGTTTSAKLAEKRLPDNATHQYIPFDAPSYVTNFLEHWKPKLAFFMESEIWPNFIMQTKKAGIPLFLLNARMSQKSFRKWRKNSKIANFLFGSFSLILTQNRKLTNNFRFLGGRNVITAGNLKIDAPALPVSQTNLDALQTATSKRTLFFAASTHHPEEGLILKAHTILKDDFPDLLTIIAPRHPNRAQELVSLFEENKLHFRQRSRHELPTANTDIYLADTIGELGTFYALSPISFIGGSLVPHGGQNPIEAIRLGSSVLTGKHVANFQDAYRALFKAGGACEIHAPEDLASTFHSLQKDPEKHEKLNIQAQAVLETLSGALPHTLDALAPYLSNSNGKTTSQNPEFKHAV